MTLRRAVFLGLIASVIASPVTGPVTGIARADPFSPPVAIETRAVSLPSSPTLAFRGGIAMRPPFPAFGGLSGMVLDGANVQAVSDRGHWVRFRPVFSEGRLTSADRAATAPILNDAGTPVSKGGQDAEDMTAGGWMSFEGDHRIDRFDTPGGRVVETLRHPDWRKLRSNGGLEAVARDPQGRVWAIAERSGAKTTPFPVFIWDGAAWATKRLPRADAYAITSATFAPDGAMYLIERRFRFLTGFRTRIRRVIWGAGQVPDFDEVILTLGPSADNLEAAAFLTIEGRLHLLLAADDNFQPLQRNILALYEVMEPAQ